MISPPVVLFIATLFPVPVDTGKKVVLSGLIRFFRETCADGSFAYACIAPIPDQHLGQGWLIQLKLPSNLARLRSLLFNALLSNRLSLQESTVYSADLRQQIHDLIELKKPDVVIFDTIRAAQFGVPQGYQGRTVVYLEDLFSLRYLNMLKAAERMPEALRGVLGNFARFLPPGLSTVVERIQPAKQALLRFESKRARRSEYREAQRASSCLLLNDKESDTLRREVPGSLQQTIKPLMTVSAVPRQAREAAQAPTFIFLGTLTIPQNSIAIEHFIETCWAETLQLIPDAKLLVIGGGTPSVVLKALEEDHKGSVQLKGFVQDIAAVLSECCAMIVPLLFGSGVKLKIIEAIAHGVPIVSTPVGIEGTRLKNGVDCLIAEQVEEFPALMQTLTDATSNCTMSKAARAIYEREYSPEVVCAEYRSIFYG